MSSVITPVTIPGSHRAPLAGAQAIGPVAADTLIQVTIRLRHSGTTAARALYQAVPRRRHSNPALTREQLAAAIASRPADVAAVERFAHQHGLSIGGTNAAARTLRLIGTATAFRRAFGARLRQVRSGKRRFRIRVGTLRVPHALRGIITGVFGFDSRPQAAPHFRIRTGGIARAHATAQPGYSPLDVAAAYRFPAGDGTGQCVALLEFGGGYLAADLVAYSRGLKLPPSQVVAVSVDGGANAPTHDPADGDGEVMLDIEIAAAVAPAARIVVYFAPNTSQGFVDALAAAVHDTAHRPDVISISWGAPEAVWTGQTMTALHELLQEAAAIGVPVVVAAGDSGATDGTVSGALAVDFPASSPAAIACGGSRLALRKGARTSETAWNDLAGGGGATGGGYSTVYRAPAWQKLPRTAGKTAMRGVPDVAADADPATGYRVRVDGTSLVIGGTSAVAPLMAGLIARCKQSVPTAPRNLAARMYAVPAAFKDITSGSNGAWSAAAGWDACSGLGVPDGVTFLQRVWKTAA
ncbi:MAG TPA: S53 family peptidase [Gemmatimonadales bacterium]|jgi:kumamolisin|nr:S53 family peptidase [Gemmatimonadales bacterium]